MFDMEQKVDRVVIQISSENDPLSELDWIFKLFCQLL